MSATALSSKRRGSGAFVLSGVPVRRGQHKDIAIPVSQTYLGDTLHIPVRVMRGTRDGPAVFVLAGVHGDELNGTGIVHELIADPDFRIQAGILVLVPVVNIFGLEVHSRYLPDRRDLNREFPGSERGSLASRLANTVMQEIILRCDCGIDLHSAAINRTNYPNVRGDLEIPGVRRLAQVFGCELVVHGRGPQGALRNEACRADRPTITLEAGEPWKIEPSVLEIGVRGVRNVLAELGMIEAALLRPPYQTIVRRTKWVRAEVGGILRFHVVPGDFVRKGQKIATNFTILGAEQQSLLAPADGIVLGMTTLPLVKPGEPVCHIAIPSRSIDGLERAWQTGESQGGVYRRIRVDLATNMVVRPSRVSLP